MNMNSKIKKKLHGFTLVEMLIVLIIIGILTVFSLGISNDQIQKVRNKTVKESILSERQSRYSRNLGSSSFSGTIYKHMDIKLSTNSNGINFGYYNRDEEPFLKNTFTDKFIIKNILIGDPSTNNETNDITLKYTPYRIACEIGEKEPINKITIIVNVNDWPNGNYCFEINKKNCRLLELSSSTCEDLVNKNTN